METFIKQVITLLGANLTGLLGVAVAGFLATFIAKGVGSVFKYLVKKRTDSLIFKFIPNGIGIGNLFKGEKPNHEVLLRAVTGVQTMVLNCFPNFMRAYVDKLIDEQLIVNEIERALTEDKLENLKNELRP